MESKNIYVKKIIKTVLTAIAGGFLGYFLFQQDMFTAIMFAGLPTGWRVLSKFFGRWVITGPIMLVYIIFKAAFACVLGWIILPIDLLITLIKLIWAGSNKSSL